ncbi:MAG: DNA repair protein RecN [Cyanobacteria bacterium Co-bin13]|nr:DNA repair protein RecN [Cyanobacteria bacterium Co-bin13]
MLTALHIENFALIDQLDLQLQPGLNVLTGETGAGKSIILDALDAVLGGKASQRLIRTGTPRALVEATFTLTPAIAQWLEANKIEIEADQLVCSRELTAGRGAIRSRSRLNGVLVNKPQIETLRQLLLEITAQGQTLQVGSPDLQREWLDSFGGQKLLLQRQEVAQAYEAATQARQALERRRKAEQDRLEQLDLFEHQARELNGVNLTTPDELDLLEQEQQRLSHSVELQQQSYQVYQILYENDAGTGAEACSDLLGKAEDILSDMLRYDPEVDSILSMVSEALSRVEEAGRQINAYGENIEADPQRLEEVEQRIRQLKSLCRKYGRSLGELIEYRDEIQGSLDLMNGDGQSLEALEEAYEARRQVLGKACSQLLELRKQAAKTLETKLVAELKPLAMDRVQFKVDLRAVEPTVMGTERVQFLFSPNPGEPLQPLAETASGGEMSRFLLALKACFSDTDLGSTLVFDEIDVGVSGRVAQAIAEKLYQLGRQHQVLCVTHQPMVAAMADAHFRVGKHLIDEAEKLAPKRRKSRPKSSEEGTVAVVEDVRTVVRVVPLSQDERREELAQLAGGHSHQESLSFAEALLSQAAGIRQQQ